MAFAVNDGKTFLNNKEFSDFSLKIVGEIHSRGEPNIGEGQWLFNLTGFVFSARVSRVITLPGSVFDGKKPLLEAIRRSFPNGTINIAPVIKNEDIAGYWQYLLKDYRNSDICGSWISYMATHLGIQDLPLSQNYWYLGNSLHIEDNCILTEEQYRLFENKVKTQLDQYATTINGNHLDVTQLVGTMELFLGKLRYFGVNELPFKHALAFVVARMLRAQHQDERWGESTIGMIYSTEKNCGKSLSLRLLAKLQGVETACHPLLVSGGDQNTSGTSVKKVLETLSSTTLMLLVDDPQITQNLGEFLNQIQSGLGQGSAKTGMLYPKGGILLSSNDKEVSRIHGRVIRFNYKREVDHDDINEGDLFTLVNENKGLLVAWIMRFLPLWNNLKVYVEDVKKILHKYMPTHQIRWIKGITYVVLAHVMIHATGKQKADLPGNLEYLINENQTLAESPVIPRLERAIYTKLVNDDKAPALTWLNPSVNVKTHDSNNGFVPAVAVKAAVIGTLADVSWNDFSTEVERIAVNGFNRSICFARNNCATIQDIRAKRDTKLVGTMQGYKIPRRCLDATLLAWIDFYTGVSKDEPEEEFSMEKPDESHFVALETDDFDELKTLEETISLKVNDFIKTSKSESRVPPKKSTLIKVAVEHLSPKSRVEYESYTPRKRRAFEMGVKAGQSSTVESQPSTSKSSDSEKSTEGQDSAANNPKKRLVFAEGTFGIAGKYKKQGTESRGSNKDKGKSKCKGKGKGKGKSKAKETVNQKCKTSSSTVDEREICPCKVNKTDDIEWVACDTCGQWYHLECSGLEYRPEKSEEWICTKCKQIKIKK